MNALVAAIDGYRHGPGRDEPDVRRLREVATAADAWSRATALHVTASALVTHPPTQRVLLRWHTRLNRWMQVGGHADPGEMDPWAVAHREAREETGLTDLKALTPELDRRPVQIVIVPVPAAAGEPAHEHADIRYAFRTGSPDLIVAESADARLRWVPLDEAPSWVEEDNLRELLARIAAAG